MLKNSGSTQNNIVSRLWPQLKKKESFLKILNIDDNQQFLTVVRLSASRDGTSTHAWRLVIRRNDRCAGLGSVCASIFPGSRERLLLPSSYSRESLQYVRGQVVFSYNYFRSSKSINSLHNSFMIGSNTIISDVKEKLNPPSLPIHCFLQMRRARTYCERFRIGL